MKAVIEIPDDKIRRAGSELAAMHPVLTDVIIAAVQRLSSTEELTLRFVNSQDRNDMEEKNAMLAVTQVMVDIASEYERTGEKR